MIKHILLFLLIIAHISCATNTKKQEEQETPDNTGTFGSLEESLTSVSTLVLKEEPFYIELIANGRLSAVDRSDIRFEASGEILSIDVKEGQQVSKGQVIGRLNDMEQQTQLRQLGLDLQKAVLDYEDHLLRLGYRMQDTAQIDPEVKRIAKLRSGLSGVQMNMEKNQSDLEKTILKAPFAGQIANLKARPYNNTSSFDYICTLIGSQSLHIEFKVLEQELPLIRRSKQVQVTPFNDLSRQYHGTISSINPMVDGAGMVTVRAVLSGHKELMDGMGTRVTIKEYLGDLLVIPKEAVLDRQDRKVVFTYEDGLAKWNYVEIAHENSTHCAISTGLNTGDEVIYQGNFNLAHDKKVVKSN